MSLSAGLSIFGLILNAAGAFIMLCWPMYSNAIFWDEDDKNWKLAGSFISGIVVPRWKVFIARIGRWLLFLGFVPQILAACLSQFSA